MEAEAEAEAVEAALKSTASTSLVSTVPKMDKNYDQLQEYLITTDLKQLKIKDCKQTSFFMQMM